MNCPSKIQFLRDRVLSHKSFQIVAFVLILALAITLFIIARTHLDIKRFLAYGYTGVFLVNMISCASVLFPVPGEAINIAAGTVMNPLLVGFVAAVGATLGEPTSYLVGYLGRQIALTGYWDKYKSAERWMKHYGYFAIFLFALLPVLIFDLIGIVAGSTRYPLWKFLLACFIGRVIRCVIEAYLGFGFLSFLPSFF